MILSAGDQVLIGFLSSVAWFTAAAVGSVSIRTRARSDRRRRSVAYAPDDISTASPPGMPPGWLFGVVWTILYLGLAAALVLFLRDTADAGTNAWIALVWLAALNYLFNATWTPLAFSLYAWNAAFAVILLCTGTALGVCVCAIVLGRWSVFGIYAVYALWLIYACVLNYRAAAWYDRVARAASRAQPRELVSDDEA